jgi:hypothetical protein
MCPVNTTPSQFQIHYNNIVPPNAKVFYIVLSLQNFPLKLYNEELHNLYFSQNTIRMIQSRRMRWTNGEKRKEYRILVGKPEGKGPLGRPRHRWTDNVKIDIE